MAAPAPNSEAKNPKQPAWPVNLGIGLATGIILGMLIASWGLRQENWQKAGFETVAAVMLVIVFVITTLVAFGTAFVRNGYRCSRWAIVIAISILAVMLVGLELFLEPTSAQRASIAKLIASGAKVLYEKENEPGLGAFFGRQYFENVTFVIWDCKGIAQPDLTYLHGLNSVNTLILENIKCPPTDLEPLQALPQLSSLYLSQANISDDALSHLEKVLKLDCLSIEQTQITDGALAQVSRIQGLSNLDLFDTSIKDAGLQNIAKLTKLRYLSLSNTMITDAGLAHLKSLSILQHLDLRNDNITDQGLKYFGVLTSLKELDLGGTQVTDRGVQKLQQLLPNCRISK